MSVGQGYDDVSGRTRQAWLRTSLGVAAVTFLLVRSLAMEGAGIGALFLAVVPATAFVTATVLRMTGLARRSGMPASARVLLACAAMVLAMATMAAVAVTA